MISKAYWQQTEHQLKNGEHCTLIIHRKRKKL